MPLTRSDLDARPTGDELGELLRESGHAVGVSYLREQREKRGDRRRKSKPDDDPKAGIERKKDLPDRIHTKHQGRRHTWWKYVRKTQSRPVVGFRLIYICKLKGKTYHVSVAVSDSHRAVKKKCRATMLRHLRSTA